MTVGGALARRYKFAYDASNTVYMPLLRVDLWSDATGTAAQRLLTPTYTPFADTDTRQLDNVQTTQSYWLVTSLANGYGGTWGFGYQFEAVTNYPSYFGSNKGYYGRAVVLSQATADPGFGGKQVVTAYSYTGALGNNDIEHPQFFGHATATADDMDGSARLARTVTSFHQTPELCGRAYEIDEKDDVDNLLRSTAHWWNSTPHILNWGDVVGFNWAAIDHTTTSQGAMQRKVVYGCDPAQQNGVEMGNVTQVDEYDLNLDPPTGSGARTAGTTRPPVPTGTWSTG